MIESNPSAGKSVLRREDFRLLQGKGTFAADVSVPGMYHAAFLRSTYAHAVILRVDTSAARALAGVLAVYTGSDIEKNSIPFLPFTFMRGLRTPLFYSMSSHRVRMVGDPIALVVAASRAVAEDALERIEVDYRPLDAVTSIGDAAKRDGPQVWDRANGNQLLHRTDVFDDPDGAFVRAASTHSRSFSFHRVSHQPLEPRCTTVVVDPATRSTTVYAATQAPHMLKWQLAAYGNRPGLLRAARDVASTPGRLRWLAATARTFVSQNRDDIRKTDWRGVLGQIHTEPRMLTHAARAGLSLLASSTMPEVHTGDIGGGFGSKGPTAREDVALYVASRLLGKSIQWVEDRNENLLDGGQAREESIDLSMAVDETAKILALRAKITIDGGAYPGNPIGAATISQMMKTMLPGSYQIGAFESTTIVMASNKGKYVPYRGPWANETFARERLIDIAARDLGIEPLEMRLRNSLSVEDMAQQPQMVSGPTIDRTMSNHTLLRAAARQFDVASFRKRQAEALADGRFIGIGFANFHEPAPGPANYPDAVSPGSGMFLRETATVELSRSGCVLARTPQSPHGQGHETTFAQLIADSVGARFDDISVQYGNTDATPLALLGTGGSRGASVGGGAILGACMKLRDQIVAEAAEMLEAARHDLRISDSTVYVAGVPALRLDFAEIAEHSLRHTPDPDGPAFISSNVHNGTGSAGWSASVHVCLVEVDLETGLVAIPQFSVFEDCGPLINPAVVDGQIRGGVLQGISTVLFERLVYDDEGTVLTGSYMDYLLPTSMEAPTVEIHHVDCGPEAIPRDHRGVGEGGMIGAPVALVNAIEDALRSRNVTITESHLPPARILELAGVI